MPYELMSCGIVVKGTGPAGTPVRAVLTTRSHDSVLAPSVLKVARDKGSKPNVLKIGEVDWGERSAIRFEPLDETWPQAVNAVIGTDALMNSTVTLWPKRKMIALRPGLSAPFPDQEQQYFLALADRNPDAVAKFIEADPRRRLLDEACLNLWTIRLEDTKSSLADLKSALDTVAGEIHSRAPERGASEPGRRVGTDSATSTAMNWSSTPCNWRSGSPPKPSNRPPFTTSTCGSAGARSPRAIFRQARRHLLSAAFGMPKNAECNFWLGEVYQKTGKLRRAWSRYFQALLDENLEKEDPLRARALERLTELNRDPEFRKTFNMTDAEEYMAGRLANSEFHAETRYRFVRNRHPHHARMAELVRGLVPGAWRRHGTCLPGARRVLRGRDRARVLAPRRSDAQRGVPQAPRFLSERIRAAGRHRRQAHVRHRARRR